jgi:NAD(P)-dependent dehydrogenase (short-subunit alcohol dehydrogenase family)
MAKLQDRVAIIFGTGPNQGGAMAHFMAGEGAKIACVDFQPEVCQETVSFLKRRGYEAVALQADATVEADVKRAVAEAVEQFGYVDIAANLVSRQFREPITDINFYDWHRSIHSMLDSGMLITKHVARAMIEKQKRGCIIHIVSSAGHYGQPENAGYSAGKAGLLNLVRAAAMDLAHYGIRVNTITPYAMEQNVMPRPGGGAPWGGTSVRTRYTVNSDDFLKSIPMGRFPRASDTAKAAVFLVSHDADFITGIDLPVDGGVRAKYPGWTPGLFTGINVEDYVKAVKPERYGVTDYDD